MQKGPWRPQSRACYQFGGKVPFSNWLTQNSSTSSEDVFLQPYGLRGMPFCNSQEGRHPKAICCPGHLKKNKKKPRRKKFWKLHFNFLPSFHQDYGQQVENTMLKINSLMLWWSLLPYPVWTWPTSQGNRNIKWWSWGYADIHVEWHWLAIFCFLGCY